MRTLFPCSCPASWDQLCHGHCFLCHLSPPGCSICSPVPFLAGVDIAHSLSLAVLLNPAPAPLIICPSGFCHAPGGQTCHVSCWSAITPLPVALAGAVYTAAPTAGHGLHRMRESSTQLLPGFPRRPSRDPRFLAPDTGAEGGRWATNLWCSYCDTGLRQGRLLGISGWRWLN